MGLFYFTASDPGAQRHLEDTIKNPFHIGKHHSLLKKPELQMLLSNGAADEVRMWGATPGERNISTWVRLKPGDYILGYHNKNYYYFGQVFGKIYNDIIAKEAWGTNKSGETWEYIFFIRDLKEIKIGMQDLALFFGYKSNFFPQGFYYIEDKRLNNVLNEFGAIESTINFLNNKNLKHTNDQFAAALFKQGEREIENSFESMDDDQFSTYIHSLDSSASIEVKEGLKKIRKYNKNIINDLKAKYNYKCQICGNESLEDYGVSVVEGHYIEEFSIAKKNNSPANMMILCPSLQRIIHKAKGIYDRKSKVIKYQNGKVDKLMYNSYL